MSNDFMSLISEKGQSWVPDRDAKAEGLGGVLEDVGSHFLAAAQKGARVVRSNRLFLMLTAAERSVYFPLSAACFCDGIEPLQKGQIPGSVMA